MRDTLTGENQGAMIANGLEIEEFFQLPSNLDIERVEGQLLSAQRANQITTIEPPLTHRFAPGIYLREIFMPANSFVIGHEHKTEHFNVILQGSASVIMGGKLYFIEAPHTVISGPGVRKVLYIHEDMIWQTIHPNPLNITNLPTLDDIHVIKSASYQLHLEELQVLKSALENSP